MAATTNKTQLSGEQKQSILSQLSPKMDAQGVNKAIAIYDANSGRVTALNPSVISSINPTILYDPEKGENRPQVFQEGRTDWYDPFITIPRLYEVRNYLPRPDKSTNMYLFGIDGTVQNLVGQMEAIVKGDGTRITIYNKNLKSENKKYTRTARNWVRVAGGKGRSFDSYVLPWVIKDNYCTGMVGFAKYIGQDDDDMVEKGQLALPRMDPRLYAMKTHDTRLWRQMVIFPIKQGEIPDKKEQFQKWNPTYRGVYSPISSAGLVDFKDPITLPNNTYYTCELFQGHAPLSTILSEMISTVEMRYFRNKAFEKVAFPPILIKVARNKTRDADDTKYLEKLSAASTLGAELRNGDSIAYEGEEYDADGNILGKGWEIDALDLKSKTLDFNSAFQLIDSQKAYGLRMSMSMLTPHGMGGERHTLSAGANSVQNVLNTAKAIRSIMRDFLIDVLTDVIYLAHNVKLDYEQIDVQFSETREQDAAGFSNIVFGAYDRNLIDEEEARAHLLRVGMRLEFKERDDLLEEMMEKQMAMQGMGMEGMEGMEGMGMEGMEEGAPEGEEEGGEEEEMEPPTSAYEGREEVLKRMRGEE